MQISVFQPHRESHKELGVDEIIDDALDNGVDTISVISSGNFIRAIQNGISARQLKDRLRVVNIVNKPFNNGYAEVVVEERRVLRPEEREPFVSEKFPNARKVRDYTDFRPDAYGAVARSILEQSPDYVALGIGSGKLALAVGDAIREKGLQTKIVGVLPKGENGVFNERTLEERKGKLFTKKPFIPTSIADKLVCPYTAYREDILKMQDHGHTLAEVTNQDFYDAFTYAFNNGILGEPSSTAGFIIASPNFRESYKIKDGLAVVVQTGFGDHEKWRDCILKSTPTELDEILNPKLMATGRTLFANSRWVRETAPAITRV